MLTHATVKRLCASDVEGTRFEVQFSDGARVRVGYDHGATDPHHQAVCDALLVRDVKYSAGTTATEVHDVRRYDLAPNPEQTWTTEELTNDFDVVGFMAPYVVVRRKADGKTGSLQFNHSPCVYFGWVED